MDDIDMLLGFLCAERQRLESKLHDAEEQLKQCPDVFYFEMYMRARYRYQYFCDFEKHLDALLNLYD